ncbi:Gx transporter family protein [Paenibacillus yanchengensis]|uniref:Gx transporter family protein n=1 Tax=Paenibacillus yanchengensis TaxID=2035833 RepID=A0ABW4YP39_9BACL
MHLSLEQYKLRRLMIISIFAALAVVLGVVEALIPFTVTIPGAKLGLGNIVVLTCIVCFGGKDSLLLILIKTLLTAFILGSFSTFLFSVLGAMGSFIIMYAMLKLGKQHFSLMMVSIMGGIAHNIGQLMAASVVLGTNKIFYYLPFLLVSGIVTGIFVGAAAKHLIASIDRLQLLQLHNQKF